MGKKKRIGETWSEKTTNRRSKINWTIVGPLDKLLFHQPPYPFAFM